LVLLLEEGRAVPIRLLPAGLALASVLGSAYAWSGWLVEAYLQAEQKQHFDLLIKRKPG
jgi:hypothetical protein